MKQKILYYINVKNKKYPIEIKKLNAKEVYVTCDAAQISQPFDSDDLQELLLHLPDYILDAQKRSKQNEVIRFRINAKEKNEIEKLALKKGYKTLSGFIRDLVRAERKKV